MESANLQSQIVIYKTNDGQTKIDVRFDENTVWLTMEQIAKLFNKAKSTINEHIINIYNEKELVRLKTIKKIGISDFTKKPTNYYNLKEILQKNNRYLCN